MKRKIKAKLILSRDKEINTIEELQEFGDIELIVSYFYSGKMLNWLEVRGYRSIAEEVKKLDVSDENSLLSLMNILCIDEDKYSQIITKLKHREIYIKSIVNKDTMRLYELYQKAKYNGWIDVCDVYYSMIEEPNLEESKLYNFNFKVSFSDYWYADHKQFSVEWYKKASMLGDVHAKAIYGILLYYGYHGNEDRKLGLELIKEGADAGIGLCLNALGAYYEGNDNIKAFNYYQKSYEVGYCSGILNYARCYDEGIGTLIDKKRAFDLFSEGAESNNADCVNALGWYYQYGKFVSTATPKETAFEYYKKAADLGSSKAMYRVGNRYINGDGVSVDNAAGIAMYELGALLRHGNCLTALGRAYINGEIIEKNIAKGLEYIHKAMEQNNPWSFNMYGWCYDTGTGVEKNQALAREYFLKAAILGESQAMWNLGYMYEYGEGGPVDLEKAFKYYLMSAENNHKGGIEKIIKCYKEGIGVSVNMEEARKWEEKLKELN